MLHEYQIALPVASNSGASYAKARDKWERFALAHAGGYTKDAAPADGVWQDKGNIYHEPMQGYRVACSPDVMRELVKAAFKLFPDQIAFYTVTGGTVHIIRRKPYALRT